MTSQSSILARAYDTMTVEEQDSACAQSFILGAEAYETIGGCSDLGVESEDFSDVAEEFVESGYQGVILEQLPATEITEAEYRAFDTLTADTDPRIAAFVEGWRHACREHQNQAATNVAVWQQAQ